MTGEAHQRRFPDRFADADADRGDAAYVVLGAPYDGTVHFREGADEAPAAIRQASWNFEMYNLRSDVDLGKVPFHDAGDLDLDGLEPDAMAKTVREAVADVVADGAFPILVGGEHSVTPPAVAAAAEEHPDLAVLQVDAHLDYRERFEGYARSHACVARRLAETVGVDNLALWGVRSAGPDEHADARADGLTVGTAQDVRRDGAKTVLGDLLDHLSGRPIYLTLDVDGIDPAYAPSVGTPEPYGLTPDDVLAAIVRTADRLVGFDVCEVSPPSDPGTTSPLAARLARDVIAETWDRGWGG